jgi:hypothetical protein
MSPRALPVALALAALAGTVGCGSGHTNTRKAAVADATAAASSDLQGKIVFRRFLDDAHSHGALFAMNANGTGKPAGQDFGGDYWTVRSDGGSWRRLTHFGPGHTTASAMWSPDGSMIVFADSGMGGNDDLYVMRADGGGVRRLTRTPQWESAAVWLRP